MAKLNELSATEAAGQIAAGSITSEALITDCLVRIAAREVVVKAWEYLDRDLALAQARARDKSTGARGPLHGVPIAIKDIFATHDMPTGMGSPIYRGQRTMTDAACVALLRAAGAVILGKTVSTEFAASHPGKTTNPHNAAHTPGGSSSGSAAAVADFMVPAGLGTQTAGSTIRPAAFCGAIGYKPSYGLFNRAGTMSESESLDTIGIITRSIDDAQLIGAVLAGIAPRPVRTQPVKPPKIGLCRTHLWQLAAPETVEAVEDAAGRLKSAGAQVTEIKLPESYARLTEAHWRVLAFEFARALAWERANHFDKLSEKLKAIIEIGLGQSLENYRADLRLAQDCRNELAAVFKGCDALLAPSAAGEAPLGLAATGDYRFQGFWTFLYTPCLTLPTHKGPKGLPVGIQLIAPIDADDALFDAARWVWSSLGRNQ